MDQTIDWAPNLHADIDDDNDNGQMQSFEHLNVLAHKTCSLHREGERERER